MCLATEKAFDKSVFRVEKQRKVTHLPGSALFKDLTIQTKRIFVHIFGDIIMLISNFIFRGNVLITINTLI